MKKLLRNTPLFPALTYLRYAAHRYLAGRHIRSCYLAEGYALELVDQGICFFGYYNISPENRAGDLLFLKVNGQAHHAGEESRTGQTSRTGEESRNSQTSRTGETPRAGETPRTGETPRAGATDAAVITLKSSAGDIKELGRSRAWNWQQGCMLQWLGNGQGHILYNDYDAAEDRYVSRVIDTEGGHIQTYGMPVNNVDKKGRFALCLNYDRLARMRPDYGYFQKKNTSLTQDREDGIWHMDLGSGEIRLILSLEDLKNLSPASTMKGAAHKVNHIDINPSGTRFMFLHRWVGPQGRFMRLVTANPDGSEPAILHGDDMISHCCWLGDAEILSFCDYNGVQGYFRFTDRSDEVQPWTDFMPALDGHPSISPDGEWLVTDTYPGLSRMSALYLVNLPRKTVLCAGRFHQPLRYMKEMRVDLHPKWSPDGQSIYFESAHSGVRQLYRLRLTQSAR